MFMTGVLCTVCGAQVYLFLFCYLKRTSNCQIFLLSYKAKIKYMSVSGYVLKKIRVGRSEKYFILFFSFYFEMV